jgi:DNA-binding NarL/FixJ family response regulator
MPRKASVRGAMRDRGVSHANGVIRVLLAEDDVVFLESLRPLIDGQPALTVVGAAQDGVRALELAAELQPDAVVIDLHMPRLDGVSAVAQLRQRHAAICLIALTGDDDEEVHQAARLAGADAVLLKRDFVDGLIDRLAALRTHA